MPTRKGFDRITISLSDELIADIDKDVAKKQEKQKLMGVGTKQLATRSTIVTAALNYVDIGGTGTPEAQARVNVLERRRRLVRTCKGQYDDVILQRVKDKQVKKIATSHRSPEDAAKPLLKLLAKLQAEPQLHADSEPGSPEEAERLALIDKRNDITTAIQAANNWQTIMECALFAKPEEYPWEQVEQLETEYQNKD